MCPEIRGGARRIAANFGEPDITTSSAVREIDIRIAYSENRRMSIPASPMMLGHLDYVERYDRDEVEKEHPAQIPPQESC